MGTLVIEIRSVTLEKKRKKGDISKKIIVLRVHTIYSLTFADFYAVFDNEKTV